VAPAGQEPGRPVASGAPDGRGAGTLSQDAADLSRFPTFVLRPNRVCFRIHWAGKDPWWFNADGSRRFDLEAPRGTCYLAETALGAFVEVGARLSYVDPDELARRSLARLRVTGLLRLADVTSPKAAGFGVTARASAGSDYPRDSQPWARRLAAAGFDGIRYGLSHEPGLRLRGLALFGEAGEHPSFGPVDDGPIPDALVAKAMARFGFRYAP
jgi:hypothetical protein